MLTSDFSGINTFNGFHMIGNRMLVIPHPDGLEDWSRVRSPGRARRRRAKHRQNITLVMVPDPAVYRVGTNKMVGHPATIAQLVKAVSDHDYRETAQQERKPQPATSKVPDGPLTVEKIRAMLDELPKSDHDPMLTGTGLSMLYRTRFP